jgi:predicted CopG family antitoxin
MFLLPFRNTYYDHDFSLIYNTIKEYYPIKQEKRFTSKKFASSAGFKKIRRLMMEEFFDDGVYEKKWGKFVSSLSKTLNKPIAAFPEISGPSLFCDLTLSKITQTDFIREKSLYIYVSVLGPFFSIHGVDHSIALLPMDSQYGPNERGNYAATHAITVSPVFEYEEAFTALEHELRKELPGYLFVPYDIGMSTIKNISRTNDNDDLAAMDTIYEGLFSSHAVYDALTRGDKHYGFSDWVKQLTQKEKKLLDVISAHATHSTSDITIHKVWKLVETKALDTFRKSGNIMFGVDVFNILDLTDKKQLIMTSEKRGAPQRDSYRIDDNVIKISSGYSLRIVDVASDSLQLRLSIAIQHENASVDGEVMELKFVQM